MTFYASIAAGVCTIWLGFEPDPDPGSGFDMDSKLQGRYRKKVMDIFQ